MARPQFTLRRMLLSATLFGISFALMRMVPLTSLDASLLLGFAPFAVLGLACGILFDRPLKGVAIGAVVFVLTVIVMVLFGHL